jgi:hypothetical protein
MSDDFVHRSLIALAVLGSVFILLFFPPFLASLWERRLVWPYLRADEYGGTLPPLTGACAAAHDALAARGFARVDTLYVAKGTGQRIHSDFWLAADGTVLANVSGGRLVGSRVDSVWLTSRLADGRYLATVNSVQAAEPDLSGVRLQDVAEGAGPDELLAWHAERMREAGEVVPYPVEDPLAAQTEMWRTRVASLVAAGHTGYEDDEETARRYTAKGAGLLVVKIYVVLLKVAIRHSLRRKDGGTVSRPRSNTPPVPLPLAAGRSPRPPRGSGPSAPSAS